LAEQVLRHYVAKILTEYPGRSVILVIQAGRTAYALSFAERMTGIHGSRDRSIVVDNPIECADTGICRDNA
jgi:hypothetical protein